MTSGCVWICQNSCREWYQSPELQHSREDRKEVATSQYKPQPAASQTSCSGTEHKDKVMGHTDWSPWAVHICTATAKYATIIFFADVSCILPQTYRSTASTDGESGTPINILSMLKHITLNFLFVSVFMYMRVCVCRLGLRGCLSQQSIEVLVY